MLRWAEVSVVLVCGMQSSNPHIPPVSVIDRDKLSEDLEVSLPSLTREGPKRMKLPERGVRESTIAVKRRLSLPTVISFVELIWFDAVLIWF